MASNRQKIWLAKRLNANYLKNWPPQVYETLMSINGHEGTPRELKKDISPNDFLSEYYGLVKNVKMVQVSVSHFVVTSRCHAEFSPGL